VAAPTIRASGVTVPIITTGAINQPSGTQVGDLVIFWLWSQAANSTTVTHTKNADASYVTIRSAAHEDGTTDGRLTVGYRIATQAGTVAHTPYTVANANANQTTGGAIALTAGTFDVSTLPPNNGASLTTTGVPNPPALAALTGDYLVFALSAWHVTTAAATVATVMANYTLQTQNANTSHVTHTAVATRALTGLNNATEDPVAWASDNVTPNGSISFTFAIRGATAPTEHTSTGLAVTAAGAAAVSGSTRQTLSTSAVDGASAVVVSASTVTGAGPTEHISSGLDVSATAAAAVSGSTRTVSSSGLALAGLGGAAVSGSTRSVVSSVGVASASGIAVSATLRTAVSSGVAVIGATGLTASGSTVTRISSGLAVAGASAVVIGSSVRQTGSSVAVSGVSSVVASASLRATSSVVQIGCEGAVNLAGQQQTAPVEDARATWERNRRARGVGRRRR
jgi:hypothetical protein